MGLSIGATALVPVFLLVVPPRPWFEPRIVIPLSIFVIGPRIWAIGKRFGLTRERVRQIKEKALSRLRHVSRARALESFLA